MTRVKNNEIIVDKVQKIANMWKWGRHMALVDRSHALNAKILSKVWFRASSIPLRVQDMKSITRVIKGWRINRNISDQIVDRPVERDGLGLYHVQRSYSRYGNPDHVRFPDFLPQKSCK